MRMEETRGRCRCEQHKDKAVLIELRFMVDNDADIEWLEELAEVVKQRAREAGSVIREVVATEIQRRLKKFKAAENN